VQVFNPAHFALPYNRRVRASSALTLLFALAMTLAIVDDGRLHASEPAAVVVELFTSEGCSSCPPADALLQQLVDAQPIAGAHIVALGEHVDYWDQQGWKDRFSSAALTNRQQTYAQVLNVDSIYTPQMIVNGRSQLVGSDAASARRAIEQAVSAPHGAVQIAIAPHGDRVSVTISASGVPPSTRGDRAEYVLAVTEDGLSSDVRRGENRGRVLTHAAVVRLLKTMGEAGAESVTGEIAIDPSWQRDRVKIVAFVQESRSRRIVAAGAVLLASASR
jgi:hypothetical protein